MATEEGDNIVDGAPKSTWFSECAGFGRVRWIM